MNNYMKKKLIKAIIRNLIRPAGLFVIVILLVVLISLSMLVTMQGLFEEGHVDERISRITDITLSKYIEKMAYLSNEYETYVTDVAGHDYTEDEDRGNTLDSLILQEYTYNPDEGRIGNNGEKNDPEIDLSYKGKDYSKYIKNEPGKIMNEFFSPIQADKNNFIKVRNINTYNNLENLESNYSNNHGRINAHLKYLQMYETNDDIKNLYVDRSKMTEDGIIDFGVQKGVISNLLKVAREMRTYYIYKAINPEITQFIYKADKKKIEGSGDDERVLTYIGNNPGKAKNVLYSNLHRYDDYTYGQSGDADIAIPTKSRIYDNGLIPTVNAQLDQEANRIYREIETETHREYLDQNEALKEKIAQEKAEAENKGIPYNEEQGVINRDISNQESIGGYDKEYDEEIKRELDNEKSSQDMLQRIRKIPVQISNMDGQEIRNLLIRVITPYGRYKITYKKVVTRKTVASYSEYLEYGETKRIELPTVTETFVFNSRNEYVSEEYTMEEGIKIKTLRARAKKDDDTDDGIIKSSDEEVSISINYVVEDIESIDSVTLYETREGNAVYLRSTPLIEMTRSRNPYEDLNLITTLYENVENNYIYESDFMDWALSEADNEDVEEFLNGYEGIPQYVGDPGGKLGYPSRVFGNITGGCAYGYRIHPIYKTRKFHTGIDINRGNSGLKAGDDVLAAENGIIAYAGNRGGYGLTVIVDHGGGITTLYAHNSTIKVRVGQEVKRGDVIAKVGSTGNSTGPHIHFEVRINGNHDNPMKYFY